MTYNGSTWTLEVGKLGVLIATLISTVILGITGVISGDAVVGILGAIVGYAAGNGNLARKHLPTVPMIGRSDTVQE